MLGTGIMPDSLMQMIVNLYLIQDHGIEFKFLVSTGKIIPVPILYQGPPLPVPFRSTCKGHRCHRASK